MHAVIGAVLQERANLATTQAPEVELDDARQVLVRQRREERARMALDERPLLEQGFDRRKIVRLERRPAARPAASIEPAPLRAQRVDERVPDRSVAAGDGPRELLGRQLRDRLEQLPIRPVAVVVQAFEIPDSHAWSPA